MLSLFVHFSVCLCSGKCYQPLSLVIGNCVLLSMIVHTLTHQVSSQISPMRSVQLRASSSITHKRRLTYTANFQSLSHEVQDSRTARALQSTPQLSTSTKISASRTSRQVESFLHSKVIMSTEYSQPSLYRTSMPLTMVTGNSNLPLPAEDWKTTTKHIEVAGLASTLRSKTTDVISYLPLSNEMIMESYTSRKTNRKHKLDTTDATSLSGVSLTTKTAISTPSSISLLTETASTSLSSASLKTKKAALSLSTASLPNETAASSQSNASLSTETAASSFISVSLSTAAAASSLSLSSASFSMEQTALSPSKVSLLTETTDLPSSSVSLSTEEELSSLSSVSLSIQTAALSPSSVSFSRKTVISSLSSALLSIETDTLSLSSVPYLRKTVTPSPSGVLLSKETVAVSLSSVSSIETAASLLSSVSLSTGTAAASLSSVSFFRKTVTLSPSSVSFSLSTETAAASLSSVSLSTETVDTSLSSVSFSTETFTSTLSSVLLSKEADTSSASKYLLAARTTSKALSEDSLSKVNDLSPLFGVTLETEATPTLSEESLSTQTASLVLSDISLTTFKYYSSLSEDSFSSVTMFRDSVSLPQLEYSSETITSSVMLSEDSLLTKTTTLLPSEGSYSTKANPQLLKDSTVSAFSLLSEDSLLTIKPSSPLLENSSETKAASTMVSVDLSLTNTVTSSMSERSYSAETNSLLSKLLLLSKTKTSPLSEYSSSIVIVTSPISMFSFSTEKASLLLLGVSVSTTTSISLLSEVSLSTKATTMAPLSDLLSTQTASSTRSDVSMSTFEAYLPSPKDSSSAVIAYLQLSGLSLVTTYSPLLVDSLSVRTAASSFLENLSKSTSSMLSEDSFLTKTVALPLSENSFITETTSDKTTKSTLLEEPSFTIRATLPPTEGSFSTITTSPLSKDSLSPSLTTLSLPKDPLITKIVTWLLSQDSIPTTETTSPLSKYSLSTLAKTLSLIKDSLSTLTTTSTISEDSLLPIMTVPLLPKDSLSTLTTTAVSSQDSLITLTAPSRLSKDLLSTVTRTLALKQETLSLLKDSWSTLTTTSTISEDSLLPIMTFSLLPKDSLSILTTTVVLSQDSLTTSTTPLRLSKDLLSTVTSTLALKQDSSVTIKTTLVLSKIALPIKTTTSPLLEDSSSTVTASSMLSQDILSTKTTTLPLSKVSSLITFLPLLNDSLSTFTSISALSKIFSTIKVALPVLEKEFSTITTTLPVSKKNSSSKTAASSMTSNDSLSKGRADMPLTLFSFSTTATASVLSEDASVAITTTSPLSKDSLSIITVFSKFSETQLARKTTSLLLEDSFVTIFASPQQTEIFSSAIFLITDTSTSLQSENSLFTLTTSSRLSKVSCSTTTNAPPLTEYSSVISTKSSLHLEDPVSIPLEDSLLTKKTSLPLSQSVLSTITTSSVLSEYSLSTITTTLPLSEYSPSTIISSLQSSEDLSSTMTSSMPLAEDLLSFIRVSLSLPEDSLSGAKASLAKDVMSPPFIKHLNTDMKMQSHSNKSVFHTLEEIFTEQSIQNTPASRTFHTDIQQLLASFSEIRARSIYTNHQMTQSLNKPSAYTELDIPQLLTSDTVTTVNKMESLSEQNIEDRPTNIPYMTSISEIEILSSAHTATRTLAPSIFSTFMIPTQISSSKETAQYLRNIFLSHTKGETSTVTESLSSERISELSTFTNEHLQVSKTVDGNIRNFSEYSIAKSQSISMTDQVSSFEGSTIKETARITESFTNKPPSTSPTKNINIQNNPSYKERNELDSSKYFVTLNNLPIPSASFSEISINMLERRPSISTISTLTDALPSSFLLIPFLMKESGSTRSIPKEMSQGSTNVSTSLCDIIGIQLEHSYYNVVPPLAELPTPFSSSIEITDFESEMKASRPVKSLYRIIPTYSSTFSLDSMVLQSLKLLTSFYERDYFSSLQYHDFINMKETDRVSTTITRDFTKMQSVIPLISSNVLETQHSSSTTMFKLTSSITQENIFSAATVSMAREVPKVLSTTFKQHEMSTTATESVFDDIPSSSSLLAELIDSTIAHLSTNTVLFSLHKQKCTTSAVTTPELTSVLSSFALEKTEGISSTGAVPNQSLLFTKYVSFEKESSPSAIKSEQSAADNFKVYPSSFEFMTGEAKEVFTKKIKLTYEFFDVLMKDSKSEPFSTSESLINDINTPKMSSPFNEFQFSEQAVSSIDATLPLIAGLAKQFFSTEDKSLSEGKRSSLTTDFPQVIASFSEFTALQPGRQSSSSTPVLTYIPNMSSSVIELAYLQPKSTLSDATSLFLPDHKPVSEYRITETKRVYKPTNETAPTKLPKRTDKTFTLDPSSAKLGFSPIITGSEYSLKKKLLPSITETAFIDTLKSPSSFYKLTLLKSAILDSTERLSSFTELESAQKERLSISADTLQLVEGTEIRLAYKDIAIEKTQIPLTFYSVSNHKEGPTLSPPSSTFTVSYQSSSSEAITSLLGVIQEPSKSYVKNELLSNKSATFKYLTEKKTSSTFKPPIIQTIPDTRHLEISASSSVLSIEITSSLNAKVSSEFQMLSSSVQIKLNNTKLSSLPEISSPFFSTMEEVTQLTSPYVDSTLATSMKEHVKSDVGADRKKQSSVKTTNLTFPRGTNFALSVTSLTGSWNSGTKIKSAIDTGPLSALFEEMNSNPTIHTVESSAMLSVSTEIHSEDFQTGTLQPFYPSDTRSDYFPSFVEASSLLPEAPILISIPCKTTLDKLVTVSTMLEKSLSERSISSSSEITSNHHTFLSPSLTSEPFIFTEETPHYTPGVFSPEDTFSELERFHGYNQRTQEVVKSIVPTTSSDISASFIYTSFQNKFQLSSEKTIYPSRNIINLLSTNAKTEYLSSTQGSHLFSGQIEERLSPVTLVMASLLESTELASAFATQDMDNTGGFSQASLAKMSHVTINTKTATSFTPSPVLTSDMASKTVSKTNSESKKIATVSPITIGILVKSAVDISSNEFEMKIKEGLKRCYYEGIAKDTETNNRRKRDASSVTVQVTGMHRNPVRPNHVHVEFYVLVDRKVQPAAQVLAILSRLTIAETSAYLSFPVIANVKVEVTPDVEKPADQGGVKASFMTYVLVGVTSVGAVIATIILAVWYCQKDQRLKQPRSSLEDADLKIDIEKGEVVSVSVEKERDLHPYVFDHGKDNFSSVVQHFEWNLTKASGTRKTVCSPRESISEINMYSASQRLKRLRKLGFRGSEKRQLGEELNETCSPTNEYIQKSGHTGDLNVINDLDKMTNPNLAVIQTDLVNDSISRNKEVYLQYQNHRENNTVQMMKTSKESDREPIQLNINIKPNCYLSTSSSRKANDSILFHSSGLDLKSGTKSEKVVPFERKSGHRKKKKLRREKKCESAKSTCSREKGLGFAQGKVQSLRPMHLGKEMEEYCYKLKAGLLYESLPLGDDSSVRNSVGDDNDDDVFLVDKIPFSDLITKNIHLSETNVSESCPYFASRRVKQMQNFSSSGNFCDIIRTCDSNTDSFFADKLDVRLGDSNSGIAQIKNKQSGLNKYQGYSSDNAFYLKNCCDVSIDGSEYAGHEFESLNFTREYTVTDRQHCEPYMMDSTGGRSELAETLIYRQSGPNICEHVTKMGRFGKKQVIKNIGPQFRKVQYQDQVSMSPTPIKRSPRETETIIEPETPEFRFNLPRKEVMKEIGVQTSELEYRIRLKESRKKNKNNISNKENGQQPSMENDHTVNLDLISGESNLTRKNVAGPDGKLGFNDTPEQKSSHKNGQELPLTKNKSLSDVDVCYLQLPGISMNNKVDDTSVDAKENIVPEKEVHYHGYLGKKDTFEDKRAVKQRKSSQFSNSLDDEISTDPKPEEFAKVDDVTGRKTTDSKELLIHRESGKEECPPKKEHKETRGLKQEAGTVSKTIDSVPYFEEVSKVDHTTGGWQGLERKFNQGNRPLKKDTLFKNEEKQYEKGPSGKQTTTDSTVPVRQESEPYAEMKLGRNMRAAPKGSIGPIMPPADINQQLLDATEPLLHSQPVPSNDIVDYYTNTQPAGFQPIAQGNANGPRLYPARSMTSPQHPSQHLIETLNRNSQTSLTHPTQQEEVYRPDIEQPSPRSDQERPRRDQERPRRDQETERFYRDSEAQKRHEQNFVDKEETFLKEPVTLNEQNTVTESADVISHPPPLVDALYGNTASFKQVEEMSATTSSFKGTVTDTEFSAQKAVSLEKQETAEEVEEIAEEIHTDDCDDSKIKDEDFDF